jgi:hypothetical protein
MRRRDNDDIQEHPMIGFQSPIAELELAKAVRAADIAAAESYRLGRLARESRRAARKEAAARAHESRLKAPQAPRRPAAPTHVRSRQPSG